MTVVENSALEAPPVELRDLAGLIQAALSGTKSLYVRHLPRQSFDDVLRIS